MRLRFVLPITLFAALAAVFAIYLAAIDSGGKNVAEVPSALIGKPVPAFKLAGINGATPGFSDANLGGNAALVNVFASWCVPCRAEHPLLMRLAREGVAIFGINVKDKPADARAFLDELGNPFRLIGADRDGRAAIDWGVYGYPETFVIDRDRRIRLRHVGPLMPHDIDQKIRPLLSSLAK